MHDVDPAEMTRDSRHTKVKTPAERLRHAMHVRGVQTNELDELAGIGGGWTSKFVNGKKPKPGAATLLKVCRALGIRSAWLMDGFGPMDADPVQLDVAPSGSRIMTPGVAGLHPDVEATVRIYRNRRKWSAPTLLIVDEVAKARHVEPDEIAAMLDDLETQIGEMRSRLLLP